MHATQNPVTTHVTPSLVQPLRDAADYLQQHGWCQNGHYADDTETPPADLIGALAIACYGYPVTNPETDLPNGNRQPRRTFAAATAILTDFLGVHDMVDAHGNPMDYTLTDWNDEGYQSIGCVTAVLRAAADDFDRTGGAA